MAGKSRRNRGGTVRKLPSGRYQVRVRDPLNGKLVSIGTYATKADADAALRQELAAQDAGTWIDPTASVKTVGEYIESWIASNPRIKSPRTRDRYTGELDRYIRPHLGDVPMRKLTPTMVRRFYDAVTGDVSQVTAAQAYRLLRAAYNTAVADELVARNPCKIAGAGQERSVERPIASIAEVHAMAEAAPPPYRALVLMAAWTSLRLGELLALTRADINLLKGTVSVTKNRQRLRSGEEVILEPKAGSRRTVAIPPPLVEVLTEHLEAYSQPGTRGMVFVTMTGRQLGAGHWWREWDKIRRAVGRPDLHFHDLRHTGNMLSAATGATTKQLMARMGHSSMAAALRYQHATEEADQAIADALGKFMKAPVVPLRSSAADTTTA